MNISLPVRFDIQLTPARWSLAEAIPDSWTKLDDEQIALRVKIPNSGNGLRAASHTWFLLQQLDPHWTAWLTKTKRRMLIQDHRAPLDSGQDEPFEILLSSAEDRSSLKRSLDPREIRDDFFTLKGTTELLSFLNRFGLWRENYSSFCASWIQQTMVAISDEFDGADGLKEPVLAVTPHALWHERFLLQQTMLLGSNALGKRFAIKRDPIMLRPIETYPFFSYTARFVGDMIEAAIAFDLLSGSKFSLCKRSDCAKPFVANRNGKQFCSYDCAHLVAVRKSRQSRHKQGKG